MRNEKLKESYMKALKNKQQICKESMEKCISSECKDEANLEKIKLNIYNIFYSMFDISYKKVYGGKSQPNEDSYNKLLEVYMEFFNKIPLNWKENYRKAKEYGLITECIIEEIKLNTADEIKDMFIRHYNEQKIID